MFFFYRPKKGTSPDVDHPDSVESVQDVSRLYLLLKPDTSTYTISGNNRLLTMCNKKMPDATLHARDMKFSIVSLVNTYILYIIRV
jgi:hypothetical protein